MLPSGHGRKSGHRLLAWGVLCTLLVTGCYWGAGEACAAPSPEWPDLPARKWSVNEVLNWSHGPEMMAAELRREAEYNRRFHGIHDLLGGRQISAVSRRQLAARGVGPARFVQGKIGATLQNLPPDTLRVLLVRVSFDTNRDTLLTTISPGGDFRLDPLVNPAPLEIDPPPHNKAYFEAHLQGLTEYYRFMSGGRLEIQGTVLPAGPEDSYKLTDVADYGPGAGGSWTLASLEALVQDVITVSDQGLINDGMSDGLAGYDDETPFTYVIFVHAGSDWQSDIAGDSPNDIPTFFVNLGTPVDLAGTNPQGHMGRLGECSIIPETTNQDGFPGSIAAAFYHEFGHALGLPDVYNTQTGMPAVGIWDLMDSGTNLPVTMGTITDAGDTVIVAATGVLPPSLSVWCKWYLGWLEMGEVSSPVSATGHYLLPAIGVPRDQYARYDAGSGDFNLAYPQAYRAGVSPREYFLIENRWVPDNATQTPFTDLKFERDATSGVIQYLAGNYRGTWENSGLYDFFMPAGGLMVWHVNADRIDASLDDNEINAWGDGLRLVEGDGIQDIGVLDSYVRGWFGSWRDPFGGRDLQGMDTGYTTLDPEAFPSSRLFDRSWSGLRLSDMGRRVPRTASVMKFDATLDPVLPGFPWEVSAIDSVTAAGMGGAAGARRIIPQSLTPVSNGGRELLVFGDAPGDAWVGGTFAASLFAVGRDGQAGWPAVSGGAPGAFQLLDGPLAGSPATLPDPVDGVDVFWSTTTGRVGMTQLPEAMMPSEQWSRAITDSLQSGPLPLRWQHNIARLLLIAAPDSLLLLDLAGTTLGENIALTAADGVPTTLARVCGVVSGDLGNDLILLATNGGLALVTQTAQGLETSPGLESYSRPVYGSRIFSAVIPELVGARLYIFDRAGALGSWFIDADGVASIIGDLPPLDGGLVCDPAVADVDGDGHHDVVLATATRIYGFTAEGMPLRGFPVRLADLYPLADSTAVTGPLVVGDGTGDGANEIYFATNGGHLLGLGPHGALLDRLPLRWGDRSGTGMALAGSGADRLLWLVSSGGLTGGFQQRLDTNGRVTGYGLAATATPSARTSEWQGVGGGSQRRGPMGLVRDLGAMAPGRVERGDVYMYPNPLSGAEVKVRFFSVRAGPAQISIYNLAGELVQEKAVAAQAGAVNEISVMMAEAVSGLYVARLAYEGESGRQLQTMTLAIER